jgi:cyclohexyl-isocyanide hydratase
MSAPLLVSDRPRPRITKQPLNVGCLIYERMDQIDFTGPFEVISRMPDTTIRHKYESLRNRLVRR